MIDLPVIAECHIKMNDGKPYLTHYFPELSAKDQWTEYCYITELIRKSVWEWDG